MRNNIAFLVGNGFNRLLANVIGDIEVSRRLQEISVLYNRFSEMFKDIMEKYNLKSQEEAIELFYDALGIIQTTIDGSLTPKENWRNCLEEMKTELEREITDKIYEVIENFIEDETSGFYGNLTRIIAEHGFYLCTETANKNKNRFLIFTTNYDGCVDIFFQFDRSIKNFSFEDLFRGSGCPGYPGQYVCFDDTVSPSPPLLFHLHGSYKYFQKREIFGRYITIKLSREGYRILNIRELIPVIIYNAPSFKEKLIEKFQLLRIYFRSFKDNLQKTVRKLVVIGQSLISDPHILTVIAESYFGLEEVVIMDINPFPVKDRIVKKIKELRKNDDIPDNFRLISTGEINTISRLYDVLNEHIQ